MGKMQGAMRRTLMCLAEWTAADTCAAVQDEPRLQALHLVNLGSAPDSYLHQQQRN
jgi:hypothetical protein